MGYYANEAVVRCLVKIWGKHKEKNWNAEIKTIEEVMLNALPSLNTYYYDGWRLRFSGGYTNRANSVNILEPSALPLVEKIHHCEEIYTAQKLPTVFKISPLSLKLDALLEQAGYEYVTKTNIMIMDLTDKKWEGLSSVVMEGIKEDWQSHYFRLNETDPAKIPFAKEVQTQIIDTTLCAMLTCGNEVVACGLAVVEGDYVGLYDIIVNSDCRKKGYGYDICCSLLQQAKEHGATKAYIQVVESNTNAVSLYHKIGYERLYDYWYRAK